MSKSTQEELLDRRIEMLDHYRSGSKPTDWIPQIAAKYDTTAGAVRRDWSNRNKWMSSLLKIENAKTLALDILYDYEKAMQDAKIAVAQHSATIFCRCIISLLLQPLELVL